MAGERVTCPDSFTGAGRAWPEALRVPQPYAGKVHSPRHLTGWLGGPDRPGQRHPTLMLASLSVRVQ
jgi:hypothetical protein